MPRMNLLKTRAHRDADLLIAVNDEQPAWRAGALTPAALLMAFVLLVALLGGLQ